MLLMATMNLTVCVGRLVSKLCGHQVITKKAQNVLSVIVQLLHSNSVGT